MQDLKINVAEIEDWQMIKNIAELDMIFSKAHSTVVNGATVVLYRRSASEVEEKFDEITTEADLDTYRKTVYRYLSS